MTLHDAIQDDAVTVFCNASDFAESATYYPRAGSSRAVNVIVTRDALQTLPADGDNDVPTFEVQVANDATYGITSAELSEGRDQLSFAVRVGQEVKRRTITKLLSHDEGMLVLECR